MNPIQHSRNYFAVCCFAALSLVALAGDKPLIFNGDFEAGAKGWGKPSEAVSFPKEGENTFLRLKVVEPGKLLLVYRLVKLPEGANALTLTYKVRYEGIEPGEKSWFDGRIMMNFKDADGKKLKEKPKAPYFRGTKSEWQERTQEIAVPEGAVSLEIMPCLFQAKGGTLDFDDFVLTPAKSAGEE